MHGIAGEAALVHRCRLVGEPAAPVREGGLDCQPFTAFSPAGDLYFS